jgi:hypothetical protein
MQWGNPKGLFGTFSISGLFPNCGLNVVGPINQGMDHQKMWDQTECHEGRLKIRVDNLSTINNY